MPIRLLTTDEVPSARLDVESRLKARKASGSGKAVKHTLQALRWVGFELFDRVRSLWSCPSATRPIQLSLEGSAPKAQCLQGLYEARLLCHDIWCRQRCNISKWCCSSGIAVIACEWA